MKKIFIAFMLCLSLIVLFCMNVYAIENEDVEMKGNVESSLKVNSDTISKISVTEGETVVKVYNLSIVEAFSRCNTIEEMINEWSVFSPDYLVISNDATVKEIVNFDSNGEKLDSYSPNENEAEIYAFSAKEIIKNDGIKLVSPEMKISNAYYISGESIPGDGVAVYYETNAGKYVYYNQGTEEYIVPLERFVEMMKEVDSRRGPATPPGANISISTLFDLSEFNIKSESFNVKANPLSNNNVIQDPTADIEATKFPVKEIARGVALFVCVLFAVLVSVHIVKSKRLNTK